jgi:hypothetical protein
MFNRDIAHMGSNEKWVLDSKPPAVRNWHFQNVVVRDNFLK